MGRIGFVLSVLLLWGCAKTGTASIPGSIGREKAASDECTPHDTIVSDGTALKYLRLKDDYRIEWSNRDFKRQTDSLYNCEVLESGVWDFVPRFYADSKRYVVLAKVAFTSGGGNPAPLEYSVVLLPKNQQDGIRELDYLVDVIENYLVYSSDFGKLHVMDLNTDKVQDLELLPTPAIIRSPTIAINEVCMHDGILIVEFEATDENDDDLQEVNFFRIEI